MSLVSMIDLEKSLDLSNNLLFGETDFNSTLNSNNNNNSIKSKNESIKLNNNNNNNALPNNNFNNGLSLHQKLLLRTLNQLTNSTLMLNGNNFQSILQSTTQSHYGSNSSLNSPNGKQMNYSRYKTELCRQFNENGECKYGDKCQFAHGLVDLKDVNRHPKYKTDFCKTFHSKGFCPYGPRCHFIHDLNNETPTKSQQQGPQVVTTPLISSISAAISNSPLLISNKPYNQSKPIETSKKNKSRKSTDVDDDFDDNEDSDDGDDLLSDVIQLATSEQSSSNLNLILSPKKQSNSNQNDYLCSRSMTSSTSSAFSVGSSASSSTSNSFNFNDLNCNQLFKFGKMDNEDDRLTTTSSSSFDLFLS